MATTDSPTQRQQWRNTIADRASVARVGEPWQWRGMSLHAGNGCVPVETLLAFAEHAAAAFPDGIVHLGEYALRVNELEAGDPSTAPRVRYDSCGD